MDLYACLKAKKWNLSTVFFAHGEAEIIHKKRILNNDKSNIKDVPNKLRIAN